MAKRKIIQRPGGQAFAIRVKPKPPPDVLQARDMRAAEKLRKAEERKQRAKERKQKAEEQKKQREIRAKLREERTQQREQQREKKSSRKGRANVPRKRTRSLVWRRQQVWKKTESGESSQADQTGRVVKLPYTVPSLAEINATLADGGNGYRVVSTFSGAGGACLGLKMAGYQVRWANDFIPAAQETYQINHPAAILDFRDVRDIHPEDMLQVLGLAPGELEVMEGSPPCSGFSMAGQREDGWGTIKNYSDGRQQVDDLFFEYARLVDGLCPMVFLAENTSGLAMGSSRGMFKLFLTVLAQCGAGQNICKKRLNHATTNERN